MKQFDITGMSCAACSARVEKAVSAVEGVSECSVNLLTNSMNVEGSAAESAVIAAVEKAGYGASVKGGARTQKKESSSDAQTKGLLRRFLVSLIFLLALMYFSMGHTMLGLPVPFGEDHAATATVQLLLAAVIMEINRVFFINGFKGMIHGAPNMDTLVSLGAAASFVWSTVQLFMMSGAQAAGDLARSHELMHGLYFESAGMILTLITLGKTLESYSKGRTTDALKGLMKLSPDTATVKRGDTLAEIPSAQVRKGDIFIVRSGDNIPADGIVVSGNASVNEAALTGESLPSDKAPGDAVSCATTILSGYIECEATNVGEDTALAKIIRSVSDAAATKAPIAKTADKVSGVFVPAVMTIAAVTLAVWLLIGQDTGFALARAVSVLVISCPCALGLATPVAIMVANGVGAKNGIFFKTAAALEQAGKTRIAVFDKTGTITSGKPTVTAVHGDDELLVTAYSLESKSEHPLAAAVVSYAEEKGIKALGTEGFSVAAGNGLSAYIDGEICAGGKESFIRGFCDIPEDYLEEAGEAASRGETVLYFCRGGRFLGTISAADSIKEDSAQAVAELRAMGIRPVMLTGDNSRAARFIASSAGIDEVYAEVLPQQKEEIIRKLSAEGKTAMTGDGINDAPALTRADTGIAIGAGTDIAIDSADVVLMKSTPADVPAAVRLSRAALRNIKQNLFWAFFYNIICIPLAAGIYTPLFGWTLSPMVGAAAMSLSSFCVVMNALRLNLVDIHDPKHDRKAAPAKEKPLPEQHTLQSSAKLVIEGMMCTHCEATVKKALEALPEVEAAQVSFEAGTADLKLRAPADPEKLKKAVEDKDYTVVSVNIS